MYIFYLGDCEYPTHPSNAWNVSTFAALCQTGNGVACNCPPIDVCMHVVQQVYFLCLQVYLLYSLTLVCVPV